MCTGWTQAEPPTLLFSNHSSQVSWRMQCRGISGSNANPLILNNLGTDPTGSRTNCHSKLASVAGNVGYVQSVDGIAGVSLGNHCSVLTTLNCNRTFSIANPAGSGSGDGLPTNIDLFSLR